MRRDVSVRVGRSCALLGPAGHAIKVHCPQHAVELCMAGGWKLLHPLLQRTQVPGMGVLLQRLPICGGWHGVGEGCRG